MAKPRRTDKSSLTIREFMDVLGWQAGEVAHELNNLLMAINGYAELGMLDSTTEGDAQKYFNEIITITGRATGLIQELFTHSRDKAMQSESINLNDVVQEMEGILGYILGNEIDLVSLTSPDIAKVKVIPGQIQQILLNLALNARDAMMNSGRLVIETSNITLTEDCVREYAGLEPGKYVMLLVSDNGSGIGEEAKAHIFEPFFTTKDSGAGTGLGLPTCNRILKQCGGYITFDSHLGQGTDFRIYLPQLPEASEAKVS